MPVYPSHIQTFLTSNVGDRRLNKQKLVDKYYDHISYRSKEDNKENFRSYQEAYLDGHVEGFADGIQEKDGQ